MRSPHLAWGGASGTPKRSGANTLMRPRTSSRDTVLCCVRAQSRFFRARRRATMIQRFDHVTVVVRDLERARTFFGLLGFVEDKAVVIKGPMMDAYMGVPGIEADHVTLVLRGIAPRLEVVGFNHVCFAVDDLEAEVARLRAHGIAMRNELMDFHSRKLIFVKGPEGITVELSQWKRRHARPSPARAPRTCPRRGTIPSACLSAPC